MALFWPALAAASAREFASLLAHQFVDLALGPEARNAKAPLEWTTPHRQALVLKSVILRDFSVRPQGAAALVCAPYALHGAVTTDLAPGHSLVEALRAGGIERLFVADWRSATPDMRFRSIDDYLADLNVLVDRLEGPVDLIGLCQGGWMSLAYAARFPQKVRKLVLAGAPIDIAAADAPLSHLAVQTPMAVFRELIALGDGLALGGRALQVLGPGPPDAAVMQNILQTDEPLSHPRLRALRRRFEAWYAATVDLPGTYYLEIAERLFKQNQLALHRLEALGRRLDLGAVTHPLFLLAACDDEFVAPAQVLATERLVGTPAGQVRKATVDGEHYGLFMGRRVLAETWPAIAHWLRQPLRKSRPARSA
ncbi:MAG: alpha/beta fold hydrolase [Variibacter sp.]|nr:alpha/beta fold hydrolase [Variibacter sp.]